MARSASAQAARRRTLPSHTKRSALPRVALASAGAWYAVAPGSGFVNPPESGKSEGAELGRPAGGGSSGGRRGRSPAGVRDSKPLAPTKVVRDTRQAGLDMLLAGLGLGGTAIAAAGQPRRAQKGPGPSAAKRAAVGLLSVEAGAGAAGLDEWLPRLSLLLMAICCSTNFTLVKILEDGHSESAVAAVRFGVAFLPFLVLVPKHLNWLSISSGAEIGGWCALSYISQAVGLPQTDASKGAFLTSLAMVVVPLVKWACGSTVRPQIWASVLLAMVGTAFLVGVGAGAAASFGAGECLCTVTAIGFGLMFVRMDDYAQNPKFDPVGCTIWQVATLAMTMSAWALASQGAAGTLEEVTAILSAGPQTLGILAWVGLVTTAGVLYVETCAMEKVDGAEAGVIFASEPVWATIFASVMLGESLGLTEAIGGTCILLACLLTQVPLTAEPEKRGTMA